MVSLSNHPVARALENLSPVIGALDFLRPEKQSDEGLHFYHPKAGSIIFVLSLLNKIRTFYQTNPDE